MGDGIVMIRVDCLDDQRQKNGDGFTGVRMITTASTITQSSASIRVGSMLRLLCGGDLNHGLLSDDARTHFSLESRSSGVVLRLYNGGLVPLLGLDFMTIDQIFPNPTIKEMAIEMVRIGE